MTGGFDYDVMIIGGGINGVGIARDAAGRGLKTGLCEKGDLAGATSSASTKLVHGGLRYLVPGHSNAAVAPGFPLIVLHAPDKLVAYVQQRCARALGKHSWSGGISVLCAAYPPRLDGWCSFFGQLPSACLYQENPLEVRMSTLWRL